MPLGVDNSWSEEAFAAGLSISVAPRDPARPHDLEFDIRGIDPAIANALRRILIADVPTVAIEHVFFVNNTSVIAVRDPIHPARYSNLLPLTLVRPSLDVLSSRVVSVFSVDVGVGKLQPCMTRVLTTG